MKATLPLERRAILLNMCVFGCVCCCWFTCRYYYNKWKLF